MTLNITSEEFLTAALFLTNGPLRVMQRKRELQMIWIDRPCSLHPETASEHL